MVVFNLKIVYGIIALTFRSFLPIINDLFKKLCHALCVLVAGSNGKLFSGMFTFANN